MKKTLIVILAALMAFSVNAAAATDLPADPSALMQKKPSKKKKAEIKEVVFSVHLHCENCVKKVQENIAFEKGVKDLKVSLENQTVAVKYDAAKTSEAVLKAAIEELGYPVSETIAPGHEHDHGHHHKH